MPHENSQEQTIYRNLAGRIQLGFYANGERFPSVQDVARRYQVSYCPAQRALKMLEKDGLVALCRGKETVVLAKPFDNYLTSEVFYARAASLIDLNNSLELLSPAVYFNGLSHMAHPPFHEDNGRAQQGKRLYVLFSKSLQALGSRTVMSLFYDIGAFVQSAYLDILYAQRGREEAEAIMGQLVETSLQSLGDCRAGGYRQARERLDSLGKHFFYELNAFLAEAIKTADIRQPITFHWEPHKGRTRHCDVIAIDLLCKINQGIHPVGSPLPGCAELADVYHVSPITIRRTIQLMNKLGVVKTVNGVGTRVVGAGDSSIPYKLKDLMLDDNLRFFLEALQLLTITCKPVIAYAFPHFSPAARQTVARAVRKDDEHAARVSTISGTLQAVVHCCPLAAIRQIYEEITLLLLKGSVLRLEEARGQLLPGWPALADKFLAALAENDGARFAEAFEILLRDSFVAIKELLVAIGVDGAERVAAPTISSGR